MYFKKLGFDQNLNLRRSSHYILWVKGGELWQTEPVNDELNFLLFLKNKEALFLDVVVSSLKEGPKRHQSNYFRTSYGQFEGRGILAGLIGKKLSFSFLIRAKVEDMSFPLDKLIVTSL